MGVKIDVFDPAAVVAQAATLEVYAPWAPQVLEVDVAAGGYLVEWVAYSGDASTAMKSLASAVAAANLEAAPEGVRPAGRAVVANAVERYGRVVGAADLFDRRLLGSDAALVRRLEGEGRQGLLHGDLTPANVLLIAPGQPVVIDPEPASGRAELDVAHFVLRAAASQGERSRLLREVDAARTPLDVALVARLVALHARAYVLYRAVLGREVPEQMLAVAGRESA